MFLPWKTLNLSRASESSLHEDDDFYWLNFETRVWKSKFDMFCKSFIPLVKRKIFCADCLRFHQYDLSIVFMTCIEKWCKRRKKNSNYFEHFKLIFSICFAEDFDCMNDDLILKILIVIFVTLVSRRLIDFHISLLKRVSLGKRAHRDKFLSIITKV